MVNAERHGLFNQNRVKSTQYNKALKQFTSVTVAQAHTVISYEDELNAY